MKKDAVSVAGPIENLKFRPTNSLLGSPPFAGISTFFRLPHVENPGDLDVAILGVPFDGGQNFRTGARFAPSEIRKISSVIKVANPSLNINPYDYLKVADVGDTPVNPLDPEVSRKWIQEAVARIVEAGALPIAVGGDHSITLPVIRALAPKYGPMAVIHIDAHLDTGDTYYGGTKYGSGTMFRRAIEERLIDPGKWRPIGIRGSVHISDDFEYIRDHGVRYFAMDVIYENGIKWVLEQLEDLRDTPCYVTLDVDGIDPAFAPGTTMPVPAGLTSLDAQAIVRHLTRFPKIVGFDIVEVLPPYDVASVTALLAASLTFEFLSTRAVARRDNP